MWKYFTALVLTAAFLYSGCSVKAPELNVTGEKTALENQVLGTYQKIESDTWLIASTRSVANVSSAAASGARQEVLEAVQNRKFNKDDVDELKRNKTVGENNQGLLQMLPDSRYQSDPDYRRQVDIILEEENRDRLIIYERVISINQSGATAEKGRVNEIFAKLNYDNSEPGTMIQQPDGTWLEKGKNAQ